MAKVLYPKERLILDYLKEYITKNGFSPTLREIAVAAGVTSPATVYEHLKNLIANGFIKKSRTGQRVSLEIIKTQINAIKESIEVPILGYIAAGTPLEPYTDPNATLSTSAFLVSDSQNSFVLQVKGESMIEDGILDGDYVVIHHQQTAENGDIVVALLENGFATLKRFFKEEENSRVRLEPANAKMSPIFATNVKIQGKVVGVIRKY